MNYYYILDVDESASLDEIKKSFRKKLKKHHPDVNQTAHFGSKQRDNLIHIINAYNVLSNPIKRRQYDAQKIYHFSKVQDADISNLQRKIKIFDYEKFLLERQNIWKYKARLLLYDLVHSTGNRAVEIYESVLAENNMALLKVNLGKFDYVDCLFLIAEYYQNLSTLESSQKALLIFKEIGELEIKQPYFKSYMEDVAERVITIFDAFNKKLDLQLVEKLCKTMQNWPLVQKQKSKLNKLLCTALSI